jgi:hypothetical protein
LQVSPFVRHKTLGSSPTLGSTANTSPADIPEFSFPAAATFVISSGCYQLEGSRMRRLGIALLTAVSLFFVGCGGGNSAPGAGNINGNWTAMLKDTGSTPVFTFTTSFRQSGGTDVAVTNFTFTTSSPCFVSGGSETASFVLAGNFSGDVTGSFELNIQSETPSGNMLALQGMVKNNTISGTWMLSGVTSGCTGNGNFTINRM